MPRRALTKTIYLGEFEVRAEKENGVPKLRGSHVSEAETCRDKATQAGLSRQQNSTDGDKRSPLKDGTVPSEIL